MGKALQVTMLAGAVVAAMSASAATTAGVAAPLWGTVATDAETRAARTSGEALLWDGKVDFTTATQQCGFTHGPGNAQALYRPHLRVSDPKAAIILYGDDDVVVIRATTNTRQMQNTNAAYYGIVFSPSLGESRAWLGGTYTFNVTPATVTAATNEVRVTGTVTKLLDIPGCTATFRAVFLRRAPDQF